MYRAPLLSTVLAISLRLNRFEAAPGDTFTSSKYLANGVLGIFGTYVKCAPSTSNNNLGGRVSGV